MSYTIDIYRGRIDPTESLIDFALFVAYFPQMVAGPIARSSELLPQFQQPRRLDWDQAQSGVYLIGWGLFKKIFIADNLLKVVNGPYAAGAAVAGPEVVVATYAFAFQIYCDFSAYTDIARGVSRLMGIELMLNFNIPYAATNPREFWRRWHISLSTWLRDYLYLPLGGSRGGTVMMYRNLMLTMVLGGIWHGARINFLWWGIYQGALLVAHRMLEPFIQSITPQSTGWRRWAFGLACWAGFFHLVCYGWLLFRADSNAQICSLTSALLTGWGEPSQALGMLARVVWFCWPLWLVQAFQLHEGNLLALLSWPWPARAAAYVGMVYLTIIFGAFHVVEFIYFQF
jgi:D-alanyl-lipoteichoic acid acyltransferase DltB (MBOAT superfamily)